MESLFSRRRKILVLKDLSGWFLGRWRSWHSSWCLINALLCLLSKWLMGQLCSSCPRYNTSWYRRFILILNLFNSFSWLRILLRGRLSFFWRRIISLLLSKWSWFWWWINRLCLIWGLVYRFRRNKYFSLVSAWRRHWLFKLSSTLCKTLFWRNSISFLFIFLLPILAY